MEFDLDSKSGLQDDLLAVAASHARDLDALRADVSAMIFPTSIAPPSEEMIARTSEKLISLVRSIEQRLKPEITAQADGNREPLTWPLLARSGFLREPELIDFILARFAEDQLEKRINAGKDTPLTDQLPARLLDHADPNVADASQCLLAADSLHRKSGNLSYSELPPELLHQLCWRVVAALEVTLGAKNPETVFSAKALLADYDENATARTAAQKLVHFLDGKSDGELFDPNTAGVHLFIAAISSKAGLDHDHVLRLIDAPSAMPLALLLRGCDVPHDRAMATIYLIKGFGLTPRDVAFFDQIQSSLTATDACEEVRRWAALRAQRMLGAASLGMTAS